MTKSYHLQRFVYNEDFVDEFDRFKTLIKLDSRFVVKDITGKEKKNQGDRVSVAIRWLIKFYNDKKMAELEKARASRQST